MADAGQLATDPAHAQGLGPEAVAALLARASALPVLLVTTHRPGYVVRWADKTYYTQIALDALTDADVGLMVSRLLGAPDVPMRLLQRVQEKAEGNPLFIEEIVTALRERGLVHGGGEPMARADEAAVEFPATLQDIVRARLDRLEDPVKRTVQTAAVIGRQFGLTLLMRISELTQSVQRALDEVMRLELVHETQFFPEPEYRFKHAIIQDVAYQSLLAARRAALHGAIGSALEELYADRLDDQAGIIAYHYGRSREEDKALAYALRAGDQAARLFGTVEATTYYEEALTRARALPASPTVTGVQIDAACKLAAVGAGRDIERDLRNLQQALALAESAGDARRTAQVLYWLGRTHYVRGEPPPAIAYAERSLGIADGLGDEALAAMPVNLLGRASFQVSDLAKASQIMARSVEQMHRLGNKAEESMIASFGGTVFGFLGQFGEALRFAERGLRVAQAIRHPYAEAAAWLFRGNVYDVRGDWARAIEDYQAGRRVAEQSGDVFRVYVLAFFESHAQTAAGRPEHGRTLAEESLRLADRIGTRFMLAWAKAHWAAALVALGDPGAARACEEAAQLADESGDRYPGALARRLLADALLGGAPPDLEGAVAAAREAIRVQGEIGARPELARSYGTLAAVLRAGGRAEDARSYLAEARGLFREMEMLADLARVAPEGDGG